MTRTFDHPAAYELLLALDGAISARQTQSIVDHLAICRPCRTRVDYVDLVISKVAAAQGTSVHRPRPDCLAPPGCDVQRFTSVARQLADIKGTEFQKRRRGLKRKFREIYAHRPHTLFLVVNGRAVAELAIAYEVNRWVVGVEAEVECIDVLSEQGVCLLGMYIEPLQLPGVTELKHTTRLSDNRDLELAIRYATPRSTLQLSYPRSFGGYEAKLT